MRLLPFARERVIAGQPAKAPARLSLFCIEAICCFYAGALGGTEPERADAQPERNVEGIMDNSFLIEEAYNQEKDVVQHIFTGTYSRDRGPDDDHQLWTLAFTQEWPIFSQTHQLSYTVPYNFAAAGGRSANGFGNVLLNYRYQAFFNPETLTALAPRASLILPTGDHNRGFGEDTPGMQLNLPFRSCGGRSLVYALERGPHISAWRGFRSGS